MTLYNLFDTKFLLSKIVMFPAVFISVLIIDEAHGRTLHTDVLLGLAKDITGFRTDLKLLISSATLNADKFSQVLNIEW